MLISKHKKPHVNYNTKRKCVNGNFAEICKKATPFKGKDLKLKAHRKDKNMKVKVKKVKKIPAPVTKERKI